MEQFVLSLATALRDSAAAFWLTPSTTVPISSVTSRRSAISPKTVRAVLAAMKAECLLHFNQVGSGQLSVSPATPKERRVLRLENHGNDLS